MFSTSHDEHIAYRLSEKFRAVAPFRRGLSPASAAINVGNQFTVPGTGSMIAA
jgi:hypothetical protein